MRCLGLFKIDEQLVVVGRLSNGMVGLWKRDSGNWVRLAEFHAEKNVVVTKSRDDAIGLFSTACVDQTTQLNVSIWHNGQAKNIQSVLNSSMLARNHTLSAAMGKKSRACLVLDFGVGESIQSQAFIVQFLDNYEEISVVSIPLTNRFRQHQLSDVHAMPESNDFVILGRRSYISFLVGALSNAGVKGENSLVNSQPGIRAPRLAVSRDGRVYVYH